MTDETNNLNEETDPLTPETFSFFDVLEGREYPKDEVAIYLNESAAYKLERLIRDLGDAESMSDEEQDAAVAEIDELRNLIERSKYVFHISGVSDDLISDLKNVADEHFEKKRVNRKAGDGTLRRVLPESESVDYTRYMNALVLAAHIEQIVAPNGKVLTAPGVDEIATFMDKAPTSEKNKLQFRISELRVNSSAFEAKVSADFLAKP